MLGLFNISLDILFPKQCLSCSGFGKYLCTKCQTLSIFTLHQRCLMCQKPSLHGLTHPKCHTKTTPIRLISVFNYKSSIISKLINTAKYSYTQEIYIELSTLATTYLSFSDTALSQFVLCPIPLTPANQRKRGFNQSLIIAQEISYNFSLPIDSLLSKNKITKQQKLLNRDQRKVNVKNAFTLYSLVSLPKHVILIDDVTTSGATFIEASKVLKRAGILSVWCLALAQD